METIEREPIEIDRDKEETEEKGPVAFIQYATLLADFNTISKSREAVIKRNHELLSEIDNLRGQNRTAVQVTNVMAKRLNKYERPFYKKVIDIFNKGN